MERRVVCRDVYARDDAGCPVGVGLRAVTVERLYDAILGYLSPGSLCSSHMPIIWQSLLSTSSC